MENITAVLTELGATVESVFIPFSQSRNKDSKQHNLNWRVTLKRNGREVLTTDYSAGIAHCPGYNKKPDLGFAGSDSIYQRIITRAECEIGKPVTRVHMDDSCSYGKKWIEPNPTDVLYALVSDSDVLDSGGFEAWAADFSYSPDSRDAESKYRACLETALQVRAAFGDYGMRQLKTAFEDY